MSLVVLGRTLDARQVALIAGGAEVSLDPEALERVAASNRLLRSIIASGTRVYGVTTGYGALVSEEIGEAEQAQMQLNLLRSHACGSGGPLPSEVVRAAMAIRCHSLLQGHSGVRPELIERVALLLNSGWVPCVPSSGSLGASGDLAPSAHLFLVIVGEGECLDPDGQRRSGADALAALGVEPLELQAKEALALINGTHFMSAIGALCSVRAERLLAVADLGAAVSVDALRGATPAFEARVHELRPVPGQVLSAAHIRHALAQSTRTADGTGERLQDAYSLRCAAQIHGSAREAASFFTRLIEIDLNAVTDNPLVFDDPPEVISAGNFHGQSLALAFDTLRIGLCDLGAVSERRIFRLVSPSTNGDLPAFLSPDAGHSSGYMILQYAAAALVSELRALATPVSIDNIPTSDNQEDHVSLGMTGAVMTLDSLSRLERILAYELICGCQAIDLDPGRPGNLVEAVHGAVRDRIPMLTEDRPPSDDLAAVLTLVTGDALSALLPDPLEPAA
ncbi:MAG: histidine ammonia-lyase [Actinobacteria bacterium]|uniref:histidine ammonia-lyase n=1 Tax=freshwater metagenome TaxID=449393 RepID=A0A6J5Z2T4_9ZZZZ|nr:histidine ammonia-lyase [Actinomycetota bacterium]